MERKTIYLCLAHMSEDGLEQKYVKEAFDTNWVVPLGPNVNAFEEELRKFVTGNTESEILSQSRWPEAWESAWHLKESLKNKQVVALSAGTAAVHLALIASGVKAGDEVCVQSFTFCASSHPITYIGATPVFIDSERDTWNMDPELLEKAILDRKAKTGKYPKAIIPVALYGMPYNCDRIMEIANKYDIPVIEDAAEGFGSKYKGQVLGTFGKFGVLSFNGNKMITTSGGGALICDDAESKNNVMWYATQARDAYPYYQHTAIGYNYRMSNVCAGIGRGQMSVAQAHINHHKHVHALYKELFKDVQGIELKEAPSADYDSNYWLCTITIDPKLKIKGQENAYKEVIKTAVGGAAGVIHAVDDPTTDCQPNENVEALRVFMLEKKVEARPVWKPMHKQPVYANAPAYVNGVSESIFKVGMCLPAGPYVTDDDVRYIVDCIKEAIEK
ncbi:MAG: DegT/DnrJ/EryC1/StrS family aminotransferase [Paludibacteraceae bacterium]|nr:DegT/DnrJ/EryC1/StrS family aminotransferase [Paludibacteraceae bacterium]